MYLFSRKRKSPIRVDVFCMGCVSARRPEGYDQTNKTKGCHETNLCIYSDTQELEGIFFRVDVFKTELFSFVLHQVACLPIVEGKEVYAADGSVCS